MIDVHSHILPELDDGAAGMDESVRMARAAWADGTRVMVATPHHDHPQHRTERADAEVRLALLRERIAGEGVALEVLLGGEVTLSAGTRARVEAGNAPLVAGGPYMLLELYDPLPPAIEQELFHYRLRGLQVVLAHVERVRAFRGNPDLLARLVSQGACAQITAQSLTSEMGRSSEQAARTFLERGLVHLIASDAHNMPRRPPGLSRAVEVAASVLGSMDDAEAMVRRHPEHLVSGRVLEIEAPRPAKRSWLSMMTRR